MWRPSEQGRVARARNHEIFTYRRLFHDVAAVSLHPLLCAQTRRHRPWRIRRKFRRRGSREAISTHRRNEQIKALRGGGERISRSRSDAEVLNWGFTSRTGRRRWNRLAVRVRPINHSTPDIRRDLDLFVVADDPAIRRPSALVLPLPMLTCTSADALPSVINPWKHRN